MQADHVGFGKQCVQGIRAAIAEAKLRAVGQVGIVEADLHVQGARPAARRGADPAEPDDAEGAAAQPPHQRRARPVPPGKRVGEQASMVGDQSPGKREHQRDRVIGDLGRPVVRHVAHRDAAGRAGVDVDVVVADPGAHQDAAAVQALDQLPVDRHAVVHDHRVGAPPMLVGDPQGLHLVMDRELRSVAEHLALDLGIVLELGIRQEDQHDLGSSTAMRGRANRSSRNPRVQPPIRLTHPCDASCGVLDFA